MFQASKAYASGVLKEGVHDRIVADLNFYASDARISVDKLWTSLKGVASDSEITWVMNFRANVQHGIYGLVLHGANEDYDAVDRFSAIAGALVRNFVRARVMTLGQVLDSLDDGVIPEHSCLLIPNFHLGSADGKATLPAWKVSRVLDLLLARKVAGHQTVVYVEDLDLMAKDYGAQAAQHIANHFAGADAE